MCLTRIGKLFHMPERMIYSSRDLFGLGLRRGAEGTRTLVRNLSRANEKSARDRNWPWLLSAEFARGMRWAWSPRHTGLTELPCCWDVSHV
jgi:hypothetical protein